MDRYTRIVLTVIAAGIWGNLLTNLMDGGRGPIGVANAQAPAAPGRVIIVGVQTRPNEQPLNVVDVYARSANSAATGTHQ